MRCVVVVGCGLMAGLGGCATLTRGTLDVVTILSDPPGASVIIPNGGGCAATPCSVTVARDAVFSVTIAKGGYASQTVAVTTRLSGTGAALATENLATAGLGLAVDAATGAALEHVPNPVSVVLVSLPDPPGGSRAAGSRRRPGA